MIHLQSNNKQQVVTDGNPYLCEDCILGRPIERLDVQVLLDPFEERLDSPALSQLIIQTYIVCSIINVISEKSDNMKQII